MNKSLTKLSNQIIGTIISFGACADYTLPSPESEGYDNKSIGASNCLSDEVVLIQEYLQELVQDIQHQEQQIRQEVYSFDGSQAIGSINYQDATQSIVIEVSSFRHEEKYTLEMITTGPLLTTTRGTYIDENNIIRDFRGIVFNAIQIDSNEINQEPIICPLDKNIQLSFLP